MILGHVVGAVWATRKHAQLQRRKLLLIEPYFTYNPTHEVGHLVAVDAIGAGVGEDVVVCLGSPARWSLGDRNLPVDAAVMGIVDRLQLSRAAFSPGAARPLRFHRGRLPSELEWI
jgi:ethanolamine utilization protein EutN